MIKSKQDKTFETIDLLQEIDIIKTGNTKLKVLVSEQKDKRNLLKKEIRMRNLVINVVIEEETE